MTSGIEEQLIKIRKDSEEREAKREAEAAGIQYLNLENFPVSLGALKLLSKEEAILAEAAVVTQKDQDVALVLRNKKKLETQTLIKKLESLGFKLTFFQISKSGFEKLLNDYDKIKELDKKITGRIDVKKETILELAHKLKGVTLVKQEMEKFSFDDQTVADFLELLMAGALANDVSDIHLEPYEKSVRVRYRLDGDLFDLWSNYPLDHYRAFLTRVKLLAGVKLDLGSRAQDGRFSVGMGDRDVELRVAISPTSFGETVVIRLLDPKVVDLDLLNLGFREDDLEIVDQELKKPYGLILNTGPTGSGKTTTLYACLKRKNSSEVKIITIEDPVEYRLAGIEQTQVDDASGYTFANGLRSILRQDPDVILVGEVRDEETANIALQAALTGHLVFSTVHANAAVSAIARLTNLKVKSLSIGPALNLVIGQRLVKKLCERCKEVVDIRGGEMALRLKEIVDRLPSRVNRGGVTYDKIYHAKGCAECDFKGYRGRVALVELFLLEKEIVQLIELEVPESNLFEAARRLGMVTMQEDGVIKVLKGITTLEEVENATGTLKK